jgi:putative hydrolase of the HAD superfamily
MTGHPKAIVFDLDDTLVQTNSASAITWEGLAREFARELSVNEDVFSTALDESRKWFWDDAQRHKTWRLRMGESSAEVLRLTNLRLGLTPVPDAMLERFAASYVQRFFSALDMFPDARIVLDALHARGTQLALITNGGAEWQRRKIDLHALESEFECIVVEGEFGVGKPDPRTYKHVLSALGVDAAETWMVGDRLDWDVLAPQTVGITGVWFDFQAKGLPAKRQGEPNRIIKKLSELL